MSSRAPGSGTTTRPGRARASAFVIVALPLLAACGGGADDEPTGDGGEAELITPGLLAVCTSAPHPPFVLADPSRPSGFGGFDIDLAQAIATELEVGFEVRPVPFEDIDGGAALASGQCDMGASALVISEERGADLDFSDAYLNVLLSLLVPSDSGITELGDLAGRVVAVQAESTGESYVRASAPDAEVQSFASDAEMWAALAGGDVDAILQDQAQNVAHALANPEYVEAEKYETGTSYGFAFEKGTKLNLRDEVNEALAELRRDGTFDRVYETFFGKP